MKDSAKAQGAAVSSPPSDKGRIAAFATLRRAGGNRLSLVTRRIMGPSGTSFGHPGAGGSQPLPTRKTKLRSLT
jgi:hypothetical protein